MLYHQSAGIESFRFYISAYQRKPGGKNHRRFVGEVGTQIIVAGVIPVGRQQFEIARPFIVPASRNVVVVEVGVIYEIPVCSSTGIETCSETHRVGAPAGCIEDGLGIKLGSSIVDVAAQQVFETLLIVELQHDAFLCFRSPFYSDGWSHRLVSIRIAYGLIEVRTDGDAVVRYHSQFHRPMWGEAPVVGESHVIILEFRKGGISHEEWWYLRWRETADAVFRIHISQCLACQLVGVDAVAVTDFQLQITFVAGIVVESDRNTVVETMLAETVTAFYSGRELDVVIEGILSVDLELIHHTLGFRITHI